MHKKTFQYLGDYQCPQGSPRVRCGIFRVKNKQIRFSWSVTKRSLFLNRHKNQFKMTLVFFVLEGIVHGKSVLMSIHGKRRPIKFVANVSIAKRAATFGTNFLRTQNQKLCCLALMAHSDLLGRPVLTTKTKNHLHIVENCSPITIKHTRN